MILTSSHTGPFQIASDEVHVWRVILHASLETHAHLHATLSGDERSRSTRFRFERDRQGFVVAHGVLRGLLARYLQTQPCRIRYVFNAFGKPDLSPEFGNRLKFNLSHSAGLALIAIAADSSVGVDLEYIRVQPDYLEIAQRFFSAAEVDHLKSLPSRHRAQAFFDCWTKTEAYVKACGEGLAKLDGASNDSSPARHWSVHTLRPAPGYVGALAIEGSSRRQVRWHCQMSVDPLLTCSCNLSNRIIRAIPACARLPMRNKFGGQVPCSSAVAQVSVGLAEKF